MTLSVQLMKHSTIEIKFVPCNMDQEPEFSAYNYFYWNHTHMSYTNQTRISFQDIFNLCISQMKEWKLEFMGQILQPIETT